MSFVANFVTGVVDAVVGTVVDIVTFDIEGLVDRAVATVGYCSYYHSPY